MQNVALGDQRFVTVLIQNINEKIFFSLFRKKICPLPFMEIYVWYSMCLLFFKGKEMCQY